MPEEEALMRFREFVRKHYIPTRTAYNWKGTVFPVIQVGRVIMVRESEALAALNKFTLKAKLAK